MKRLPLTPAMSECLDVIRILTTGNIAPSYQQIADHLGLASKCGVHRLVHSLKDRGYIDFAEGRYRTIYVLDEPARGMSDADLRGFSTDTLMHIAERANSIIAERQRG